MYTSTSPDQPSKPDMKPATTPDCIFRATPGSKDPGKVTFGGPSVIKPAPRSLFTKNTATSLFSNSSQPETGLLKSHLEAYVIRPTVETTDSTSTLSYADQPLRLKEAAMQAQMRSLGPDFSLVDEFLNLDPQQSNLMQRRAANRHGEIVSIHRGKPLGLQTVVGAMQVKSVVYIISTSPLFPLEGMELPQQCSCAKDSAMCDVSNSNRSLFGRLGTNVSEPPTATDKSGLKWYPKPVDPIFMSARGPPGGTFAGYTVNNSEEIPSFNNTNACGLSIGSTGAFRPGLQQAPSMDNPFGVQGAKLPPSKPVQVGDFCTTEHQHGLFCRVPPTTAVKTNKTTASPFDSPPVSASQKDPKQSTLDGLTEGPNLRFGPAVGASDPSDQSRWIMHPQVFCKFEHQHGKRCRVSPEEVAKNQRPPLLAKPAVFPLIGQLASSSSQSLFGTLGKSPFGVVAPKPFEGFFGGVEVKSHASVPPYTSCEGLFGGPNNPNTSTGGNLFGGGASTAQPATGSLFGKTGGQISSQNAGTSLSGDKNDQQKLVTLQTWPQSQLNHCFPAQSGSATFAQRYPPTRPGGLFSFSNAPAQVAPLENLGQPHQTARPSGTPSRPLCGLFGDPDTSTLASPTLDQPGQIVPPSPWTTSFNNVHSSTSVSPLRQLQ